MRKWFIIEDEVPKAELAIKVLKGKNEQCLWIYISSDDINKALYPNATPDYEIKSNAQLTEISKIFQDADEIVLLLDVQLRGIINDQDDFSSSTDYLDLLSEIAKKNKYYFGIYSNKVDASTIEDALKQHNILNIYKKYGFKKDQETVENGISEIINKWNSLYESLTINNFIKEYDKIKPSKDNIKNFHYKNKEYVEGRDLIKRLIRLDDNNINAIFPSDNDNILSGFLKGLFEKKGISLFGIYLIAWAVYAKEFNNHKLFLKKFKEINDINENFSRYKMFLKWNNDESKKFEYLNQIYEMFEELFSCNHFSKCANENQECTPEKPVLIDLQTNTILLTLSFDLCINGKNFNDTFDSKVNSLFNKNYSSGSNESCEKILMVMKNTWGKKSGISFETNKENNYLKIKFYIV